MNRCCSDNQTLGGKVQVDTCYDLSQFESVSEVFKQRDTFHKSLYYDYGPNYFAQLVICNGDLCNSRSYQGFCGYRKVITNEGRVIRKDKSKSLPEAEEPESGAQTTCASFMFRYFPLEFMFVKFFKG